MKVALWTPTPDAAWVAALRARLGQGLELAVVPAEPKAPPPVEIDIYHVAGSPAHGFVYRALLRRPGIVLLAEWGLHALVHAETAGRGDARAYRREARRAHGDTGEFVARQVLKGVGGALPALVPLNRRVLDASLALLVFDAESQRRATALLPGHPVRLLPVDSPDADAAATALRELVLELAPRAAAARREIAARAAREDSLLGSALGELRWAARELGLAEVPADSEPLVASLFGGMA